MAKAGLVQWIQSINVADLMCLLKDMLEARLGKDFALMKGYSQNNPHHCYDLLEHTLQTVLALDCTELFDSERIELQIAALYHDVGKPKVALVKNGKTVFYNHAKESKKIAENELKATIADELTIERICFFIEYHDMFISFKLSEEIKAQGNPYIKKISTENVENEVTKVINEQKRKNLFVPSLRDFDLLLRLCRADAMAQSDKIIEGGKETDSKERKLKRLNAISQIINNI